MPGFPDPSVTTASLTAYVFTALRKRIAEHQGLLHRLHIGDTWRQPVGKGRCDALAHETRGDLLTYAPVHGMPDLIDAAVRKVERRTGLRLPPDAVQVVAGATGGLSNVVQALLDPGDEVLLPSPFWPLIRGIIASRGARPVQVSFFDRLDDRSFDPEATLEAHVTDSTAAIYVNSPHNPTGRILPDDVVAAIARVARRHDLWVLSDEVYEDIWYGDEPPAPVWTREDLRRRTLAVHSMSKGYGMAGSRIGFVHGPPEIMGAVKAVQTFQAYCAAKPMQILATHALEDGDGWLAESRELYGAAGRRSAEALGLPAPEGGTFLFFDASRWLDEETDILALLERCIDAGVVLTPGAASGDAYGTWLRVCYTNLTPDLLEDALTRLRGVLPT